MSVRSSTDHRFDLSMITAAEAPMRISEPGTALVGSAEQARARIEDYR